MKKRWLCLFTENESGVLARISGLFSGKLYNLDSLTVGVTEDETVSRMTIGLTSDERTFGQLKKQLERCVEVLSVEDCTGRPVCLRELMLVRVCCTENERPALQQTAARFGAVVLECSPDAVLLQCVQTEECGSAFLAVLRRDFPDRVHIARGGSVAMEMPLAGASGDSQL